MGFEKIVDARLWYAEAQNSDVRLAMGDTQGGAFVARVNPLRGTLLWDRCSYILYGVVVTGGATGGSYTVTVQTDAVVGYTGLPIASATLGPNSPSTVVLTNLHNSPASPLPTHLFIDQTATGGTVTFTCWVKARQYRGTLGTPGMNTSERVIQGTMLTGTNAGGFADSRGMTEDATFTLGTTGSARGLDRMQLWDTAFFWAVAGNSVAGTHDVDLIGRVNVEVSASTFSIASTGSAGALNVAGEKLAMASNMGGAAHRPLSIIWTEVTAGGVSDARVVCLAKTGRGSLAKQ